MQNILITGGAGFIGSHLSETLLSEGFHVIIYDSLSSQVHGKSKFSMLKKEVEFIHDDVRNKEKLKAIVKKVDAVIHFAAKVGVGQSMYEIVDYMSSNSIGTSTLLECMMEHPVKKLIVASSMSIYGEGLYKDKNGIFKDSVTRSFSNLQNGDWNVYDDESHEILTPVPTPENKVPELNSVYALSKYDQERLCLMIGSAYKIPTIALRFFNVYGPGQSLSNPYTGVLAIFASRLLLNKPVVIFEDGMQMRDFVSVYDVCKGCVKAIKSHNDSEVYNIGSGHAYTVLEIADELGKVMGKKLRPMILKKYRVGDIRNCFADITKANKELNFYPDIDLNTGLKDLSFWLEKQVGWDAFDNAFTELNTRGLAI